MNIAKLPLAAALLACAFSTAAFAAEAAGKTAQSGAASWYGPGFHGKKTASGERFNQHAMTAAHRTLPFGTKVRVVHERTGRSVVVRINDRAPREMPFVIDLSRGSARALGITATDGIAPVAVYKMD